MEILGGPLFAVAGAGESHGPAVTTIVFGCPPGLKVERQQIQAYLDRYQIEFNHRDAKTVLGVGEAQVWGKKSTPRVPEFIMAAYSALLLAGLAAYGPKRGEIYRELPKWRRKAKRPSCQDLVTLLRQQLAREEDTASTADQMILTAAA